MSDIAHALIRPTECTEGVTRHDEFEPCDKPAVAVRLDPECGEPYPVCARHARADMVLLPDVIAAVRAQVAGETTALVQALQAMCDDEWLRRRDRIMRLPGTRYVRDNGAGEIEYAAHMVRSLIGDLPGYDPVATSGAYLDWMRNGRDEGADDVARGESS